MTKTLSEQNREQLYRWLDAHRMAWSGWPTFTAFDAEEITERLARLKRHNCPVLPIGDPASFLRDVDDAIASLRHKRRGDYAAGVAKAGL